MIDLCASARVHVCVRVFSDICLFNVSAINSNSCHQSSLNTCASAPGSASLIAASAVFGEGAAARIFTISFFFAPSACVHARARMTLPCST